MTDAQELDELAYQRRLQAECDHDPNRFCPVCRRPRLNKPMKENPNDHVAA